MIEIKEPIYYNCCTACGIGSSKNTRDIIIKQTERFGEFICEECEKRLNMILESDEEFYVESMGELLETLITEDCIYYFESDRDKIADPKSSFLGFAGSWFLIIKTYKEEFATKRKIMLSNNLWHYCTIPKPFQEKFKKAGKINARVIGVTLKELKEFKQLINKVPYID